MTNSILRRLSWAFARGKRDRKDEKKIAEQSKAFEDARKNRKVIVERRD